MSTLYPGIPENRKTFAVTDTSYYELACPSTTTGSLHVSVTSSLAFTLVGRIGAVNSTSADAASTDWFSLACTNQAGTSFAAGTTATPTANDHYEFDTSGCTHFAIKPSAGTGTVKAMCKGVGGTGSGAGSGGGAGSALGAYSLFGEAASTNSATVSYVSETCATGAQATAFSTVTGFTGYLGRSAVEVTNTDTSANIFLLFCATSSTPTPSATKYQYIVPPGKTVFFPINYAVRIRWAHDSASTVTALFTEVA